MQNENPNSRQMGKLLAAICENLPELFKDQAQLIIEDPVRMAQFLRDIHPEIVRPNRDVQAILPSDCELVRPELEGHGPTEYSLTENIRLMEGAMKHHTGEDWYAVKYSSMYERNFTFSDIIAIQSKGVKAFKKYFQGCDVSAWDSAFRDKDGDIYVWSLILFSEKLHLKSRNIKEHWHYQAAHIWYGSI